MEKREGTGRESSKKERKRGLRERGKERQGLMVIYLYFFSQPKIQRLILELVSVF